MAMVMQRFPGWSRSSPLVARTPRPLSMPLLPIRTGIRLPLHLCPFKLLAMDRVVDGERMIRDQGDREGRPYDHGYGRGDPRGRPGFNCAGVTSPMK